MKNNIEKIAEEILEHIQGFGDSKPSIIAIDGRCASGKTTLAALLKEKTGCNVIHADHFFLRKEQRTQQRLEEAGGNIDFERLRDEVLLPLRRNGSCSYRKFDCKSMSLSEEEIVVKANPLTVVEGSYSCHPELWDFYDLRIFLSVGADEQAKRIERRNGVDAATMFRERWIPLEEKYFAAYRISQRCDLVFNT